jgi:hypothetical protein
MYDWKKAWASEIWNSGDNTAQADTTITLDLRGRNTVGDISVDNDPVAGDAVEFRGRHQVTLDAGSGDNTAQADTTIDLDLRGRNTVGDISVDNDPVAGDFFDFGGRKGHKGHFDAGSGDNTAQANTTIDLDLSGNNTVGNISVDNDPVAGDVFDFGVA